MPGATFLLFSFGSGACSTLFRMRLRRAPSVGESAASMLRRRIALTAEEFTVLAARYAATHGRFGFAPTRTLAFGPGRYCVREIDSLGRRLYDKADSPPYAHNYVAVVATTATPPTVAPQTMAHAMAIMICDVIAHPP